MSTLLIILAIIFILAPLAQGYARRLNPPELPGVNPRDVGRLREEVDQLTAQVNRLQDEQSFMLRLLTEGGKPPTQLPPDAAAGEPPRRRAREARPTEDEGRTQPDTPDGGL
jgi:hypothetical protein